jgi:hypothetical protein
MIGLKNNRRGDIPITILVIGIFAVCTLAILSFISSTISLRNSFVGIDLIEKMNKDIEITGSNHFFNSINKGKIDYVLNGFKDELLFSVEYTKP